jgi:transposase
MAPTPSLPEQLWKTALPELQAAILALVALGDQRLAEFQTRVADLENQFKQASTRSSKTPSSDPIGLKRWRPAPPRGRNRGGQPVRCGKR